MERSFLIKIIVANKYKGVPYGYKPVYIGRPSIYGNPFIVGKDYIRGEAVDAFREYFDSLPEDHDIKKSLRGLLSSPQDIALVCYCAPKKCHGDVLKEYLEKEMNNG